MRGYKPRHSDARLWDVQIAIYGAVIEHIRSLSTFPDLVKAEVEKAEQRARAQAFREAAVIARTWSQIGRQVPGSIFPMTAPRDHEEIAKLCEERAAESFDARINRRKK